MTFLLGLQKAERGYAARCIPLALYRRKPGCSFRKQVFQYARLEKWVLASSAEPICSGQVCLYYTLRAVEVESLTLWVGLRTRQVPATDGEITAWLALKNSFSIFRRPHSHLT